jgi:uracil-DNA glycosylase
VLTRATALDSLLADVRACRACADILPMGPRPIIQMSATARVLIAGQAPGTKAHASGIPFSDPSGERLREWMGVSQEQFYDALRLTLLVGAYAQVDALGPGAMTERVRHFQAYLPRYFPLPHPSWRTRAWATKNPWFEAEVLPALRLAVQGALA